MISDLTPLADARAGLERLAQACFQHATKSNHRRLIVTLMIEALDESLTRRIREKAELTPADIDDAIVEGGARRMRPLAMSVLSTVLGLLPLMWEAGPGADVAARIAAPLVGGLWPCMILTLLVLPAAYAIWRRWQLGHGRLLAAPASEAATA